MTENYNQDVEIKRIQYKTLDALIELATPKVKDLFLGEFKKEQNRDWTQEDHELLINLRPRSERYLKEIRNAPPKAINLLRTEKDKMKTQAIDSWDIPLLQKAICIINPKATIIDYVQVLIEDIRNPLYHEGIKQVEHDKYIHQKNFLQSIGNLQISQSEIIEIFQEAQRRMYYNCKKAANNLCDKAEIYIREGQLQVGEEYCKKAIKFLNHIFMNKISEHVEILKQGLHIINFDSDIINFGVSKMETLPFHAWRATCLKADCADIRNNTQLARITYKEAYYDLHQNLFMKVAEDNNTRLESQGRPLKCLGTILNYILLENVVEKP